MSYQSPRAGIVSTADQTDAVWLPLESLSANVYIADVTARVILSQVYVNSSTYILQKAYYIFPIPARAAVCSFEMQTDDGRRLKGIVKELSQAKADFEEALSQGKLAGLLEQFRQDVFVISVGAILRGAGVTVTISYVMDLAEDDEPDTVRFQLPSHVGARYGVPSTSRLYEGTAHKAHLSITIDIEMPSPISSVTSLTHRLEDVAQSTQPVPPSTFFVRKQFVSRDAFLDRDFLLVVQAPGLDYPRCLAEPISDTALAGPSKKPGGALTTAFALTIVPRFRLPTIPVQEYIFVIDRSGSMSGSEIETAKRALVLLLGLLPSNGTTFNIVSFGSHFSSLWDQSQPYCRDNLQEARVHAESMDANMGGTELCSALDYVFGTRNMSHPTNVFILTDGYVYQPDLVISRVKEVVSSAPSSAPLRLFTLGIGNGASTELCEGIAREGNGACTMALEVEDLVHKAARFVNAMQVATVKEVAVDWGVPGQVEGDTITLTRLSPGVRALVTAILPGEQVPTKVILRGRLSDGSPLKYEVPVTVLTRRSRSSLDAVGISIIPPPLLHTLAAHRFIQNLEYGELSNISGSANNLIIDLGTRYQIASSLTAFVAIDMPLQIRSPRVRGSPGTQASRDSYQNGRRGRKQPGDGGQSPPSPDSSQGSQTKSKDPAHSTKSPGSVVSQAQGQGVNSQGGGADPTTFIVPSGGLVPLGQHNDRPPSSHLSRLDPELPQSNGTGSGDQRSTKTPLNGRASGVSGKSRIGINVSQAPKRADIEPGLVASLLAHEPQRELANEIICLPDPSGGNRKVIFTAPPLPHIPVFSLFRRSFFSRLFRPFRDIRQVESEASAAKRALFRAAASSNPEASSEGSVDEISDFARLQDFDGSFSLPSIATAVRISDQELRFLIPSELITADGDNDIVWATAIAVAFLREKFPRYSEIWEGLQAKAFEFGSLACGRGGLTFEHVVQQAATVLLERRHRAPS